MTPRPPTSHPGTPSASRGRSTALLDDLFAHSLDPAYARAAARRHQTAPTRPRTLLTAVAMVLAGLLLTLAVDTLRPEAAAQRAGSSDLVTRIEERRALLETQAAQVEGLRREVAALQVGAGGPKADDLTERATAALQAAGGTAVTGPGLRLVLDDAPTAHAGGGGPRAGDDQNAQGRVSAADLQQVVNSLWAAGAEGISINGHRLTSTAAIRFAGDALIVAFRPLTRPYTVEAIGGPELRTQFGTVGGQTYLEALGQFGIRVDLTDQTRLTLPAGTTLSPRYASTAASAAPPRSASSASSASTRSAGAASADVRPASLTVPTPASSSKETP